MTKLIKLNIAAQYSNERVKLVDVTLDNYITTDNILQNKAGITKAINLPPKGSSTPSFKEGNILVGNIRPYLKKIWFADKKGGCSSDVLVFDVKQNYDPKFIFYTLFRDDFFAHMMRGSKGTKMPRGDKNQILSFLIPNYVLTEQQSIANILSTLDSKIKINNNINTELEAMAKIIFDYWFMQFDFPNFDGKPYKTSGGKLIWNDLLKKEIPEGWAVKPLGELGDFKNGINYDPSIKGNTEVKIINVRNISDSNLFISQYELDSISLQDVDVKNYLLSDKDILIARSGIPGATRLMLEYQSNTIYCGFIIRFLVNSPANKNHLFFFIKKMEESTTAQSAGTIMQNVNQDTLTRMRVILPDERIVEKFNNLITPIFEQINRNINETHKLSELRDWLLPMLMNGQVTIKEASNTSQHDSLTPVDSDVSVSI